MPGLMQYIADMPGVIGGNEPSGPRPVNKVRAEIDIQLHRVVESKGKRESVSESDLRNFVKNVGEFKDGQPYLDAVRAKFPDAEGGVDVQKWKAAVERGEIPPPPKRTGYDNKHRDLYWYDTKEKRMLHFKGDRLDFVYNPKAKKQVPVPVLVAMKTERVENNSGEILSWVEENAEGLWVRVVDGDERSIIVEFPDRVGDTDNKDRVEEALYSARLRYGIINEDA